MAHHLGAVLQVAAIPILVAGVLLGVAAGHAPSRLQTTLRSASPLPTTLPWRIAGMRKAGNNDGSQWHARVDNAFVRSEKLGPFRFNPLKTLDLTGFTAVVTSGASATASVESLKAAVSDLPLALAAHARAAKISAQRFELTFMADNGQTLRVLEAEMVSSKARANDSSPIELTGVAWRDLEFGDLQAGNARINTATWQVEGDRWLHNGASICASLPLATQ